MKKDKFFTQNRHTFIKLATAISSPFMASLQARARLSGYADLLLSALLLKRLPFSSIYLIFYLLLHFYSFYSFYFVIFYS
jgi:hypothetical protein